MRFYYFAFYISIYDLKDLYGRFFSKNSAPALLYSYASDYTIFSIYEVASKLKVNLDPNDI